MDSEVNILINPKTPITIHSMDIPVVNVVVSDNDEINIPIKKLITGITSKINIPPI
ncbi:MAG: hypothetical protein KAT05_03695 [Spirochaetes bacterium]|nr:hypothetical protein [Spirochaetota bacterium]